MPTLALPHRAVARAAVAGKKKGEERARERAGRRESEKEREKLTTAFDPSTASMAGDIVVIEADPWDPSDITVEML